MDTRVLSKARLPSLLLSLRESHRVIAPQRVGPAEVVFDDLPEDGQPTLAYVNSLHPPKSLFFQPRETLFTISGSRRPTVAPPPEERPIAIFGLRSCDATALVYLERFFGQREFDDPTVTARIQRSLRLTLACAEPGPDCFCVCCEGGPSLTTGFDLQFTELGEEFLVDIGTSRGLAVVDKSGEFTPATPAHEAARRKIVESIDARFTRRSYMSGGVKRISLNKVSDESWEKIAEHCESCGGCCFVCPTCSCFTVNDVPTGEDTFARERLWDACMYEAFTREASGHNPRSLRGRRLKRRFFHKLSYQYTERMGRHGCVGCGRCVTTCPAMLDISNILERLQDATR